ncbi:MAG: hypothetical protein ABW019_09180 [Chitinophagaceae bacterium]
MIRRIITTLSILVLSVTAGYGQAYEPMDLAKKIFARDSLINPEHFATGEYAGHPNGQDLNDGTFTKFTLLEQTAQKAVIGMTITDSSGRGIDTYLYFKKDTTWKMSAFRSLAMTGIIEQMKLGLERMTPQEIDQVITKSKDNKKDDFSMFASREEYDYLLGNARLILDLDENIIQHFRANQAAFERIRDLALQRLENEKPENKGGADPAEDLKTDYRKLFITSVKAGRCDNCADFLIGGMLDNSVGYLFVKDKKDLPEMDADNFIVIKEIGNGWYLYKTT